MSLTVLTGVSVEPVTLSQAKAHLNVVGSADDAYITTLISVARDACEHSTGRSIGEQVLELALDEFPVNVYGTGAPIRLLRPPVVSITSLTYTDEDGVAVVVDQSNYTLDSRQEPSWLCPAYGYDWPSTRAEINAVRVVYSAGYTQATIPKPLAHWIMMYVAAAYESRERETAGQPLYTPMFVDRMIDRYRVRTP